MTLYRALHGEHGLWVRPTAMFNEALAVDGVYQPRFTWISDLYICCFCSNSATAIG